jgi:hypothetical protein
VEDAHCVGDNHSSGSGNWRSGVLGGAVGLIINFFASQKPLLKI